MADTGKIFLDEDTSLMLKAAKGDSYAYEKLYKKYFHTVTSFIASFNGQLQSTEDLSQEVFVRIWENKAKYQPYATFKTYLFGYAKNVLREYKSNLYKEGLPAEHDIEDITTDLLQSELADENELIVILLKKLITELPDKQRQSIELVYLCSFPPAEAAKMLKCSLETVYTSLYRARMTLRQSISRAKSLGETRSCQVPTQK